MERKKTDITTHLESQDGDIWSGGAMVSARCLYHQGYRFESCPDHKKRLGGERNETKLIHESRSCDGLAVRCNSLTNN